MFQATNPRDKIYAVIGLPSVEQDRDFDTRSLLRPDYSKEVWEVYGNVVRHFVGLARERTYHPLGEEPVGGQKYGEGVLDILRPPERHGLLGDKEKEVYAKIFPSWVPRWDLVDESYRHPPGIWAMDPKFLWRPAGDLHVGYLPPKNDFGNRILEVKGVKIGVVDSIFDHVLQPYSIIQRNSKGCVKKLLKQVQEHFAFDLRKRTKQYHGPGTLEADFAEVITAGSLTQLSPKDSTSSMETLRKVAGTEGLVMQEWLGTPAGSMSSAEYLAHQPKRSATGDSDSSSKKTFEEEFKMWLEWDDEHPTLKREKSLTDDSVIARFGNEVNLNRTFFVTKDGRIGVGSPKIRVGDEIWVLYGGRCLYVVRHGDEAVDAEIQHMKGTLNVVPEKGHKAGSPKKGGIFGMGRSREPSEGGSPKKGGFMTIGTRQRGRDTGDTLSGSPKKGGIFRMGRLGSRDTNDTLVAESGSPKKGGTRSRPISGETTIGFSDDVYVDSPKKGSIYGSVGRRVSGDSGKFGGIMGRKSRDESREAFSNSTTPRARSPQNFGLTRQTRLFVGEAFVSGWMDNEAVSGVANGQLYEGWLVLI